MSNEPDHPPSFQFYPRDFLASTSVALMTPEARGGYIMLMCHAWMSPDCCSLPDDDDTLKALSGLGDRWAANSEAIKRPWNRSMPDARPMLTHPRLEHERKQQLANSCYGRAGGLAGSANLSAAQRTERAKTAANARWHANGSKPSKADADIASASASASAFESTSKELRTSQPRFTPPTLDDVREYCRQRRNGIDPEAFLSKHEANGWRVGKNPMKDWKATVRYWERTASTNGHAIADDPYAKIPWANGPLAEKAKP